MFSGYSISNNCVHKEHNHNTFSCIQGKAATFSAHLRVGEEGRRENV